MFLGLGADNKTIRLVVMEGTEPVMVSSMSTDRMCSVEEYAVLIGQLLHFHRIELSSITDCGLSCVVPQLNPTLKAALTLLLGRSPFVVCAGIKTGLNIKLSNASAIGADFICNCVGALIRYTPPLIVVSFEAAATFAAIDAEGTLIGRSIFPGLDSCTDVLSTHNAQLPYITLDERAALFGKDTVESMQSGLLYGFASLLDGMITRYGRQLKDATVVSTGSIIPALQPHCENSMYYESNLLFDGLMQIARKNQKR